MPAGGRNRNPRGFLLDSIADTSRRVSGLERQQLRVTTDPSQADGDPANNYATVVEGYLGDICSIDAYGIAVWRNGEWVQINYDTGWVAMSLTNSWTGSLSYRVIGNEIRLNGSVSGGASGNSIATLPAAHSPVGDGVNEIPIVALAAGARSLASLIIPGSGGQIGQIIPHFTASNPTLYLSGFSLLWN